MSRPAGPAVRVVLDTNVFLSGIFFGGIPGRLLDAWQAGHLTLVLSPAILAEYHRAGAALAARYPGIDAALHPLLALGRFSARACGRQLVLRRARAWRSSASLPLESIRALRDAGHDVFSAGSEYDAPAPPGTGRERLHHTTLWTFNASMTIR